MHNAYVRGHLNLEAVRRFREKEQMETVEREKRPRNIRDKDEKNEKKMRDPEEVAGERQNTIQGNEQTQSKIWTGSL